jgi:hypothetical protein
MRTAHRLPEKWKPIDGYEEFYEVSSHGRVRSLDRQVERVCNGKLFVSNRPGKLFSLSKYTNGYLGVMLTDTYGIHTRHLVHRLVAIAFLPKPKLDQTQVMHRDDDRTNAYFKNLKWGTPTDNMQDMVSKGRQSKLVGEATSGAKLTAKQVTDIRALYMMSPLTKTDLAKLYGVGLTAVRNIVDRKRWKHLP